MPVNRCYKIIAMASVIAFSIMSFSLAATKAATRTGSKKGEEVLSPSGLTVLQEKMKSYPVFDEEKVKAEAEEKYKLAKIGDKVTVNYRRGQISGIIREIDKKSVRIGDTRIIFVDMNPEEDIRFLEDKCKALRTKYVKSQQNIYNAQLQEFTEKTQKELEAKYPAIGNKRLAELFSKMKDMTLRDTLSSEFASAYDKSLPLDGARLALIAKTAGKFAADKNLSFDGDYFRTLAEMEEEKAKIQAEARRTEELRNLVTQRADDRFLLPKTASPIFKPDGGIYAPKQKVELSCPTPGATIYYTTDGKEPTEDSNVYTEPIIVQNAHVIIKAKAFHPLFNDSEIAVLARFQEIGTGLCASYFDKVDCTGKIVTRFDKTVDFNWGTKSPDPAIPPEYFSAIWAGSLIPKFSETYKFYTTADNGSRMWIDDSLLIDNWVEDVSTRTAEIKLTAGRKYDFKIAFCETWGAANIKLEWSSPSTPRQVIPQGCLYPDGKYVDQLEEWNRTEKGVYVNRSKMVNPLSNGKTTIVKAGKNPDGKSKLEDHITR